MKRHRFGFVFLLIVLTGSGFDDVSEGPGPDTAIFPRDSWAFITTPALRGWSPEKLRRAELFAKRIQTAAVMVVVGGKVAAACSG